VLEHDTPFLEMMDRNASDISRGNVSIGRHGSRFLTWFPADELPASRTLRRVNTFARTLPVGANAADQGDERRCKAPAVVQHKRRTWYALSRQSR